VSRERRRAALAALCVLAVALAATLLPASGFGGQPAGVGVGGGGSGQNAPGGGDTDAPPQTAEPTAPTDTTSRNTETTTSDGGDETTTTATTTTAATTPDSTGGGGLLGGVLTALLGLGSVLAVVGFWTGALSVSRAAGPVPFTLAVGGTPLGELVGSVPTRTMATVVALSSSVPRLLDDAATLAGAVGRSLGTVIGAAGRGTAQALRFGAEGLALTVTAIPRAFAGLAGGASLFSSLGGVSVPSLGRGGSDDGEPDRSRRSVAEERADPAPPSVEEAWEAMRDRVPVGNRRARTPGEVARAAARRGYPDESVRRLTDAFREVRYGDLPRDERTDSARSALDRLRDYWRGDGK
jgi:hypothetical protein